MGCTVSYGFGCSTCSSWTDVLRRHIIGMVCSFWARKPVNHTSWVALVTPTDRPKSVRNRCLIELFCGVVCVVTYPFDISVGVGAFVIGLGQISSFLSYVPFWDLHNDVSTGKIFTFTPIYDLDTELDLYRFTRGFFPWSIYDGCGMPTRNA